MRKKVLAKRWKESVISGQSLGDASNYYASAEFEVEIFTGDEGLKAYEPAMPVLKPRRRK